ncbi:MAG: IS21 family transposase [Nitriliruptoraceae bacterium]|nr:IS21 family transposase [Nitriliruptoraceae bacterium]
MQDWAEVHRLFHRDGLSKSAIARRLGMSRTTVIELLARDGPPSYVRAPAGSMLDPFKDEIRRMLADDPGVAATVVLERIRRSGFEGRITIVRDFVAKVRPQFAAAQAFQRTSYLPGEIGQVDWWHTGIKLDVGRGALREAFGLVVSLPHSAAHAVVFTLAKDVPGFLAGLLGALQRLGGVPEKLVFDNDTSIVASRQAGTARLHLEVAALLGQLAVKPVVLRPATPTSKGQVERTIRFLETSFVPLRTFTGLADLQAQHDRWAAEVAFARHHRRVGAVVGDAWATERGWLKPLPDPLPDVSRQLETRVSKDCFVRVGNADYSIPPGLAGRRVQIALTLERVVVRLEGTVIVEHDRSWIPADVVMAPTHLRLLREHREARKALAAGDVEVPVADLSVFDALAGGGF